MMNMYAKYPLKDISQPHAHDVLCGRGGGTNNHIGNSHWRMLVAANKQLYITLPKRQKMLLSRSIVNAVRSQNPPGRFLQKESKTNLWYDVGDQRAQEKTSQALREGAPDIRKKVAAQQQGENGKEEAKEEDDNGSSNDNDDADESDEDKRNQAETGEAPDETRSESTNDDEKKATANKTDGERSPSAKKCIPVDSESTEVSPPSSSNHLQFQQQAFNEGNFAGFPTASNYQQQQMYTAMQMLHKNNANNRQAMMAMQMQMMGGGMNAQQQMYMNQMHLMMMSPQVSAAGTNMAASYTNNICNMSAQAQHYLEHQRQTKADSGNNIYPDGMSIQHQQQYYNGGGNIMYEPNPPYQEGHNEDFNPLPVNDDGYINSYGTLYQDRHAQGDRRAPTFDELVAATVPEGLDTASISFGSIPMSDAEIRQLDSTGTSFSGQLNQHQGIGVYGGGGNSMTNNSYHKRQQMQSHRYWDRPHDDPVPAAPDGIDGGVGLSFGDVSMMSAGTNGMKLDDVGTSFGTMMSGLEAIGASFGSLSLDARNRDSLFRQLEIAAAGPEIQPQYHPTEQKASGNLLECSDTESETEEDREKLLQQKSQAWERMKSQIVVEQTTLKTGGSKGSVDSQDEMPPPPVCRPAQYGDAPSLTATSTAITFLDSEVAIPTAALENNFSTLSAWTAVDDFNPDADDVGGLAPPPPVQLKKVDDEW